VCVLCVAWQVIEHRQGTKGKIILKIVDDDVKSEL
jgi:hypothetical protein